MKKHFFTILLIIFCIQYAFSQHIIKNNENATWYKSIAQEQLFIHYNSSVLFTGENLHYSVYGFNSLTNQPTKTSKITYVELVGENDVLFKHKINLNNGLGQGDFFIPSSVITGNYKLIAYTQWMRNGGDSHFFQADLTIINPYSKIYFDDKAQLIKSKNEVVNSQYQQLKITTNEAIYDTREKVSLQIESLNVSNSFGNYSISVRKQDEVYNSKQPVTSKTYKSNYNDKGISLPKRINDTIFLPESRGGIITGSVVNKNDEKPAVKVEVALSILSNEAYQDIVFTNKFGVFNFHLKNVYSKSDAIVQVLGDNKAKYKIDVASHKSISYNDLKFSKVSIHPSYKENIIKRSVSNQIENGYQTLKKGNVIYPKYPKAFYGNYITTYILDDYKRFPTIAETLVEVVDHAWHERNNGKQRVINIREREHDPYYGINILPMIVVDGALVQDHGSILYYDTKKVKSISVLRDEYYYGDRVYQGVLMINTFDKDFYKSMLGDNLMHFELFSPLTHVDYFKQTYNNQVDYDRIPDYRNQLLWMPNFELNKNEEEITFYTSDVKGVYEISIEGFTNKGLPISIKSTFNVK